MKKQKWLILSGSLLFFSLDLIIKLIVKSQLVTEVIVIPHFFSLQYVKNTGGAFSLFSDYTILLVVLAVFLFFYLYQEISKPLSSKVQKMGYLLIIGGLFGNLWDRIFYGYVVDYLSFTIASYAFPIFNLADIGIVIGCFLVLIMMLRGEKDEI